MSIEQPQHVNPACQCGAGDESTVCLRLPFDQVKIFLAQGNNCQLYFTLSISLFIFTYLDLCLHKIKILLSGP